MRIPFCVRNIWQARGKCEISFFLLCLHCNCKNSINLFHITHFVGLVTSIDLEMESKKMNQNWSAFVTANAPNLVILCLDSHVNSKNPFARCYRIVRDTLMTASTAKSLRAWRFSLAFFRSASCRICSHPDDTSKVVIRYFFVCVCSHIFVFLWSIRYHHPYSNTIEFRFIFIP